MLIKLSTFLLCASIIVGDKKIPQIVVISMLQDGGVNVEWNPVSPDEEPVIGYKIFIVEVKEKTDRMFKLINGDSEPGLVRQDTPDDVYNPRGTSVGDPKVLTVMGADSYSTIIKLIKTNKLYEINMLAFTAEKDGPKTEAWRFKILEGEGYKLLGERRPDMCSISLWSKPDDKDEYGYVHNIHF